jgi:hypothetical protein
MPAIVSGRRLEASSHGRRNPGTKNGGGKKQYDGPRKEWPKYTINMMLDKPCSFHTFNPAKPAIIQPDSAPSFST